jgi:hypothetical protein
MFTAFEVSFFIADGARGGLVLGGWDKIHMMEET